MSSTLAREVLGKKAVAWVFGLNQSFISQRGFNSIVRNGSGDYTLTLTDPISPTDVLITGGCNINLIFSIAFSILSPTQINVQTARLSPGGPAIAQVDCNFWICVEEFGPD